MRTYNFTNLYSNELTVYILIKVITLDPGRYFLKHWMRVLPIENSARGGFIPFIFYCSLVDEFSTYGGLAFSTNLINVFLMIWITDQTYYHF